MDKPAVDSFFKITSRLVIVFPVLVIVAAFFLWNPGQKNQEAAISPTPEEALPTTPAANIDINGSYICRFNTGKEASVAAYIKKKSLYVQRTDKKKTGYLLFQKDCLYEWQKDISTGQMTCGLSQYVSMFENMSRLGLASPDTYLQTFLGDTAAITDAKGKKTTLAQSCVEKNITDSKIFEVPKTIQFIKKKGK